jgi:hypothetical protein
MTDIVYLSIVVVNNTGRDDISPARKVDNRRRGSGALTEAGGATVALGDGSLNGYCVICETVTLRAKVLDISEDLVRSHIRVEGCEPLVLDVLEPVRSTASGWASRTRFY